MLPAELINHKPHLKCSYAPDVCADTLDCYVHGRARFCHLNLRVRVRVRVREWEILPPGTEGWCSVHPVLGPPITPVPRLLAGLLAWLLTGPLAATPVINLRPREKNSQKKGNFIKRWVKKLFYKTESL